MVKNQQFSEIHDNSKDFATPVKRRPASTFVRRPKSQRDDLPARQRTTQATAHAISTFAVVPTAAAVTDVLPITPAKGYTSNDNCDSLLEDYPSSGNITRS
jgi:hypothetical protein